MVQGLMSLTWLPEKQSVSAAVFPCSVTEEIVKNF